ncbi:TetR/AcrR family transcriptional regulator [Achromobacter aloeverae]|uniref:TetR/AcrR family transcriptional regulator n=1 Tax=Achromobacter aloeverae TaxID=1750518 RepID=UPI001300D8CC|nr:TetR/AcrR family transcriptional regulator [Achromobacter aloeverae]
MANFPLLRADAARPGTPDVPAPPSGADSPVAERILQAARQLIALKGPATTTVRDICDASSVNVAAVNYYFGSKDALVRAALMSILEPVNIERRRLLEDAKQRFRPNPVPIPVILDALFRPIVQSERAADGGRLFIRAENHLRAVPDSDYTLYIGRQLNDYAEIFIDAMADSLPQLTRAELIWRYEFARGAAMHLLSNCDPLSRKFQVLSGEGAMIDLDDDELVLRELVISTLLGLSAPAVWSDQDLRPGQGAPALRESAPAEPAR